MASVIYIYCKFSKFTLPCYSVIIQCVKNISPRQMLAKLFWREIKSNNLSLIWWSLVITKDIRILSVDRFSVLLYDGISIYSIEWYDDWWIGKDLERSCNVIIEVLSWHLLRGMRRITRIPPPEYKSSASVLHQPMQLYHEGYK